MTAFAPRSMARRLTIPFGRGADTLVLSFETSDVALATFESYDFKEHAALYDDSVPDLRYIVIAQRDVPIPAELVIAYEVRKPATPVRAGSASVVVPAGTLANTSFVLNLNADEGADTRLLSLHMSPALPGGAVIANSWSVVALLGNLAKLLWLIGWEKDVMRHHLELITQQRHLPGASGQSLDWLGSDLGVPRFPPRPYSFDPFTVALYHLDDRVGATPAVEDTMKRYGGVGHPGSNIGGHAEAQAIGRFEKAFAFRDVGAEIQVPHDAELNTTFSASFSIEGFVNKEVDGAVGDILSKLQSGQAGWTLSIGEFGRGVPDDLRFLLSDGKHEVTLFCDEGLKANRFYHFACILDRDTKEARLYLDGQLRALQTIDALGTVTNSEPLRFGRSVTALHIVIDEVRISNIARTTFGPIFGEEDEAYRQRLRIFQRWTLPTPAELQRMLNEAVGQINGVADPLLVKDDNEIQISGSRGLMISPQGIAPGKTIDALGNRNVQESEEDPAETFFDPAYLVIHNDARAIYAAVLPRALKPGELAPDPHKMLSGTSSRLTQLLDLLKSEIIPGQLHVESAFDPRADDRRAVGRGLLLMHESLSRDQLGALAQRAGFAFVRLPSGSTAVYVSVESGTTLAITVTGGTATGVDGFDLRVGETLQLQVQPKLPADTLYHWTTIHCGEGQAQFTPRDDLATTTLLATMPGELVVKVEATRRHHTVSSTQVFRVGLITLVDPLSTSASIGDDGRLKVSEDIAGTPDEFFHPAYLLTHDDARATYGTDINNRRMQPSVAVRLSRLLGLIQQTGAAGQLEVTRAYVPGAPDLQGVGRALTLHHGTLPAERLGALAHAAGFTYVLQQQGQPTLVRQGPDELITIAAQPDIDRISEGTSINLSVSPQAAPQGIALNATRVYTANGGSDTVSEIDIATGQVLRAVKVGWQPVALVLSPDNKTLFTADARSNTVTRVDLATGAIETIPVGQQPSALAHHPTQPRLYVACSAAHTLVQIDISTRPAQVLPALAVGNAPVAMALTGPGTEIWVALNRDRQIQVVRTSDFTLVASIALISEPLDIALTSDSVRAYVTAQTPPTVSVLNVTGRTLLGTMPLGASPGAVALAPDNATIYVADTAQNVLHFLAPLAAAPFVEIETSIHVHQGPSDLVADASQVYVANHGSSDVSVIQPQTGKVGLTNIWRLGSGLNEQLTWILRLSSAARAHLSSTSDTNVRLIAEQAGPVLIRAVYFLVDLSKTKPYTFEVKLIQPLVDANAIIHKEQYDLIMNILNAFHPVGVEVNTRAIRKQVIEVSSGLLNAFPDYTYPNFRFRRLIPGRIRKE